MKRKAAVAALCFASLGTALMPGSPAGAQDAYRMSGQMKGYTIRTGSYFNPDLGRGLPWLAMGLDAPIRLPDEDARGGQTVSLDYVQRGRHNDLLGLTAVQHYNVPNAAGRAVQPVYGLGAGIYRMHMDSGSTKIGPGLKALAGLSFSNGMLLEADYHLTLMGRTGGLRGTGLALTMGYRF